MTTIADCALRARAWMQKTPATAAWAAASLCLLMAAGSASSVGAAQPDAQQERPPTAAKPASEPTSAPAASISASTPSTPPPLDLNALEMRLRETPAIGLFTKLALKNQVDDLLSEVADYHQGRIETTLPGLRQAYDGLVLKVLALLQDTDPPLAKAIASSREAIWGILSDRAEFRREMAPTGGRT